MEPESNGLILEVKSGKKASDVLNTTDLYEVYDSAKEFSELVDSLEFLQNDCFMNVYRNMGVDCDSIHDQEKKLLTLRFTQCYYELLNKTDEYPYDKPEEDQIAYMSESTYNIFLVITLHLRDLCYSARRSMNNEAVSYTLLDLFKSVIDNSKLIVSFFNDFNSSVTELENFLLDINSKMSNSSDILIELKARLIVLLDAFNQLSSDLTEILNKYNAIKLGATVIICALVISSFLPELFIPICILTALFCFADIKLASRFQWWRKSVIQKLATAVYLSICSMYPIYKIINSFKNTTAIIARAMKKASPIRIKKATAKRSKHSGTQLQTI